ncbi:MaoC/PaaZ C-terminal domain-containing protein [Labrenzia sp. DG1229]|uniref:MaoC family dehydratase n=1 Tax=Labrenzia sp. DG1229 TaxID=681847 RepID=UPI00048AE926|nr:MaoC/PaaZ C-terminal domain-containing protein [Labrenzia sp. DG1229]
MSDLQLAPGRYGFDEVDTGDRIHTPRRRVTASDIDAFASQFGDRFEIHMDDVAARSHGFPGRVAHGLLVLSLIDGLKNQSDAQFRAIASLGWDWSFRRPVFVGDELGAVIEIMEKRKVTKPDRGILALAFSVANQRGEIVQDGSNKLLVYR